MADGLVKQAKKLTAEGQSDLEQRVQAVRDYELQVMADTGIEVEASESPVTELHLRGFTTDEVRDAIERCVSTALVQGVAAAAEFAQSMSERQRHWMLASHHPFEVLGRDAKKRFNRLRDQGGARRIRPGGQAVPRRCRCVGNISPP